MSRLLVPVFRRGTRSMTVGGLNVLTPDNSETGIHVAVRARLGLALELIDAYAPRIGTRLRHDVSEIFIERIGCTSYNPYTRMIGIDIRRGITGQVEDLALALVHEGTHARQTAMGVSKRPTPALEARLEAHAVAQSIAFAERLPAGTWSMPRMADLETEWWSRERREARLTEVAKETGIKLGPLRFLIAILRWLRVAR